MCTEKSIHSLSMLPRIKTSTDAMYGFSMSHASISVTTRRINACAFSTCISSCRSSTDLDLCPITYKRVFLKKTGINSGIHHIIES